MDEFDNRVAEIHRNRLKRDLITLLLHPVTVVLVNVVVITWILS